MSDKPGVGDAIPDIALKGTNGEAVRVSSLLEEARLMAGAV